MCSHAYGYFFDGVTLHWLISFHANPNTAEVYLDLVLDRTGAMDAVFIKSLTNGPMFYDCADIYAMRLSVSSMRLFCGDGNPVTFITSMTFVALFRI